MAFGITGLIRRDIVVNDHWYYSWKQKYYVASISYGFTILDFLFCSNAFFSIRGVFKYDTLAHESAYHFTPSKMLIKNQADVTFVEPEQHCVSQWHFVAFLK